MASGVTIAVVGATGAAGQTTLKILEERKFPVRELRAFASERSVGKSVRFRGEDVRVARVNRRPSRAWRSPSAPRAPRNRKNTRR